MNVVERATAVHHIQNLVCRSRGMVDILSAEPPAIASALKHIDFRNEKLEYQIQCYDVEEEDMPKRALITGITDETGGISRNTCCASGTRFMPGTARRVRGSASAVRPDRTLARPRYSPGIARLGHIAGYVKIKEMVWNDAMLAEARPVPALP